MLFANTCIDNFLNNPQAVVEVAESCEYKNDGVSPGRRSEPLHKVNYNLYNHVNVKILSSLYPNESETIQYKSYSVFQKIPAGIDYDGWIHTDKRSILTAIIFLSESDAGTSIYEPKDSFYTPGDDSIKRDFFKDPNSFSKEQKEEYHKIREKWVSDYKETISYKGRYNRMICFDGFNYHNAHVHKGIEDRLTLITFFDEITIKDKNIKYPLPTIRGS